MSSNLGLILTSAGVAAVVSAIVSGIFTMWNDRLRRNHESQVRENDRQHDRDMQALADRRAQRDHRGQRIYSNVQNITQFVVDVGDQAAGLRLRPQDYLKAHVPISNAIERLKKIQPDLMLDAETAALFNQTVDVIQALNVWFASIENREQAKKAKDQPLGELTKEVFERGDALMKLLDSIVTGAREALSKAEAALE